MFVLGSYIKELTTKPEESLMFIDDTNGITLDEIFAKL